MVRSRMSSIPGALRICFRVNTPLVKRRPGDYEKGAGPPHHHNESADAFAPTVHYCNEQVCHDDCLCVIDHDG